MGDATSATADTPAGTGAPAGGFRPFVVLWAGQFASMAGSSVSGFALGIYAYQLTGSVTALGSIYALSFLPLILASPFAGSLVDRWGTHRALLVSNVAAMAVTLVLAALLFTGSFRVWHIYGVVIVMSLIGSVQTPAFEATVPLLVPKPRLGRANGMRMFALATSQVLAPVAAGFLLLAIGISGIVVLDCVSFGFALLTLAAVRVPRPPGHRPASTGVVPLLRDFGVAWRYVRERPGLVALLVFLGAHDFCAGFVDLLITPMVLAFASSDALGTVMSLGGVGMVAASLILSAWGGPRRPVHGVLGFSLLLGVATIIGALRPSLPLITVGAVLFLGSLAIIMGCNLNIWQTKVEPHLLGRTMALLNMAANTPQLVSYVVAGPLADGVAGPLVGRDEVHSPAVAALVGQGPGRGIALLLMVVGVLIIGCAVAGFAYPRLRRVDSELPDVGEADPAEPVGAGASASATGTSTDGSPG
jgi:MFS transporter, DHA3 family, macrolide efflux protein